MAGQKAFLERSPASKGQTKTKLQLAILTALCDRKFKSSCHHSYLNLLVSNLDSLQCLFDYAEGIGAHQAQIDRFGEIYFFQNQQLALSEPSMFFLSLHQKGPYANVWRAETYDPFMLALFHVLKRFTYGY